MTKSSLLSTLEPAALLCVTKRRTQGIEVQSALRCCTPRQWGSEQRSADSGFSVNSNPTTCLCVIHTVNKLKQLTSTQGCSSDMLSDAGAHVRVL
jgi:hypothetical protein